MSSAPTATPNPPIPTGWKLMTQNRVTPEMTAFAVAILHDNTLLMSDQVIRAFKLTTGTRNVLARVEWHPPDFNNKIEHRGVTLYEPTA